MHPTQEIRKPHRLVPGLLLGAALFTLADAYRLTCEVREEQPSPRSTLLPIAESYARPAAPYLLPDSVKKGV